MIDRLAAPQRTALAWSRTALAGATLAGAAVKTAAQHPDTITLCCAVITSLAAVGIFLCGQRRASYETGARTPAALLFRIAVLCALAAVVAGTVLVVLPHG
jgi:low temperature requirement protein LtrA